MIFKVIIDGNILDEEFWKNEKSLIAHHSKHVKSSDDEPTDPDDPKYDYMTIDDYKRYAEELSEEPANIINSIDELRNARGVFGWSVNREENKWKNPRSVKFRRPSKLNPNYEDMVVYSDDFYGDGEVIAFYLARNKRKFSEFGNKVDELPENRNQNSEENNGDELVPIDDKPVPKEQTTDTTDTETIMKPIKPRLSIDMSGNRKKISKRKK